MGFKTTGRSRAAPESHGEPTETTPRASARKAAAARANGKKGGRPPRERRFEDFADVRAPPTHPVKLGHWMQRILALEVHRMRRGRDVETLSEEIRGYTIAMSKLLRPILLLAAADLEGAWWRSPPDELPPADDPVAMAYWLLCELALNLHSCIQGRDHPGAKLRKQVSAYVKAIPPDTLHDARDKVMQWSQETRAAPGPTPQPANPSAHVQERYRPIHC